MIDAIKMKGRLLLFDKPTSNKHCFRRIVRLLMQKRFQLFGSFVLMILVVFLDPVMLRGMRMVLFVRPNLLGLMRSLIFCVNLMGYCQLVGIIRMLSRIRRTGYMYSRADV